MSLKVAINDNAQLLGAEINDKGSLVLTFDQVKGGSSSSSSESSAGGGFLDSLNSTSDSGGYDSALNLIQFPYKMDQYTTTAEDLFKNIQNFGSSLNHILLNFTTEDKIKWNLTEGLPLDMEDPQVSFMNLLRNEEMVKKIYHNQCSQFIAQATPFFGKGAYRLKLKRQSKANHYAVLPKFPPFMEPMTIPADQSSLQWSKYEIDNGLNIGTPVKADTTDSPDSAVTSNVFGSSAD